jgi:hypothetical protein
MPKKKYIKRGKDGRYYLIIQNVHEEIDVEKKTKLWISSDYLFLESIKENPKKTEEILSELIKWNVKNENYENCQKLKELFKKLPQES